MGAKQTVPDSQELSLGGSPVVSIETPCTSDILVYIYFTAVENSNIIGVNTGSQSKSQILFLIMHIPVVVGKHASVEQNISECMDSFRLFRNFGPGTIRPINQGGKCRFHVSVPALRSTALYDLVMAFTNSSISLDNPSIQPFQLTQNNVKIWLNFFPFNIERGADPLCLVVLKNYLVDDQWENGSSGAITPLPYKMNGEQQNLLQAIKRKSSGTFVGAVAKSLKSQGPDVAALVMANAEKVEMLGNRFISQSDHVLKSYMQIMEVFKKELNILNQAINELKIATTNAVVTVDPRIVKKFLDGTVIIEKLHAI